MDLTQPLNEAKAERQTLLERVAKLDLLIGALNDFHTPDNAAPTTAQYVQAKAALEHADGSTALPRPREAVLDVLPEFAGKAFEPKDVTARIRELGKFNEHLKSGPVAYSTALSRLLDEPDALPGLGRDMSGFYSYNPPAEQGEKIF